jgi:hypothetical protein
MDDLSARVKTQERRDFLRRERKKRQTRIFIDEGYTVGEVASLLDLSPNIIDRIREELYGRGLGRLAAFRNRE